MPTSVERAEASAITAEAFRVSYVARQIPLLLRGLTSAWPARHKWSAAYFRERLGDLLVPVRDYSPAAAGGRLYINGQMRLSEYLDYWEALPSQGGGAADRNLYLAEWNFVQQCPELLEDFATPDYFLPDWMDQLPEDVQFGRVWLFIGQPSTHTPAHTDTFGTSAWLSMVSGTKAVRLVSPAESLKVPRGTDFFAPGAEEDLLRLGVDVLEAIITEGDTLFIPGRWLHQVRNLDKNIMVTKNFVDTPNLLGFLSDFETGVIAPIHAMRDLRLKFLKEQLDDGERTGAPACLASLGFMREQLRWATQMDDSLRRYRERLSALLAAAS